MPSIIVTSRYTRNTPRRNAANLVEYMGTREGVEKVPAGRDKSPSTRQQFNLILDLAMEHKEANGYSDMLVGVPPSPRSTIYAVGRTRLIRAPRGKGGDRKRLPCQ